MPGSGVTSREVLAALSTAAQKQFADQLAGLPFKRGVREALVDGFLDGFRSAVFHLKEMRVIEVLDENTSDPASD